MAHSQLSQSKSYSNNKSVYALWVALVAVSVLAVVFWLKAYHSKTYSAILGPDCENKYTYINTRLACGSAYVISKAGYAKTQQELTDYADQQIKQGTLKEFGIYFRDLEDGPVFGINETEDFAPASLLKLPVALTYLNLAANDPSILQKNLSFQTAAVSTNQHYPPKEEIKPNTKYTIEDLLRRMIQYSDNVSAGLLEDYLTQSGQQNEVKNTFLDMGLIAPNDNPLEQTLTVRRYGSIFRSLYNVSYLDPELDEKLLQWMSDSDFDVALKAGVPGSVKVAHKFGERVDDQSGTKQLHDCGIVYYPGNPYLLCVMTRGNDFDQLAPVIAHISEVVYKEVDSRRGK